MSSVQFPQKLSLGIFPTPVQYLNNLSEMFQTNLYVKRDDMTGVALGGNKVRKLEFLLADAKAKGYDLVMPLSFSTRMQSMPRRCAHAAVSMAWLLCA